MRNDLKNNIYKVLLCVLIVSMSVLTSCNKKSIDNYEVYYGKNNQYKLVKEKFATDSDDPTTILNELLVEMKSESDSNPKMAIFSENLEFVHSEINGNVAVINLNEEYFKMDNVQTVLFRMAVVKTVTQIKEVEYVMFYVNDQSLTYNDGTSVGMLSNSDFIDGEVDAVNGVDWRKVDLYFADKTGSKLVKEKDTIAVAKGASIEKLIVERLIKGPSSSDLISTLPQDMKVLSVTVNDGVCYVNLSSSFITGMVNVSNEIPIYSIVDSLCTLNYIDSVKIMINGNSDKLFRESISLDKPFIFTDLSLDIKQ